MIYFACILAAGLFSQAAWADIYIWVDDNGVKHISDLNPPPHAELFLQTDAQPYDKAADLAQRETEKRQDLLRAQAEIREREERLAIQASELESRMEDVEQKTQEALERAEDRLQAAEERYGRYAVSFAYVARPFGARHYRYKHAGHPTGHRVVPSFEGRPFSLGAIHIPLFSARDYFQPQPSHGDRLERPWRHQDVGRSDAREHPRGAGNP
jgi:hypothetical protein